MVFVFYSATWQGKKKPDDVLLKTPSGLV